MRILERGRRTFIASLFCAPASFIATHCINRNAAINETVKMRLQEEARKNKPVDPMEVSNFYSSQYWAKVKSSLPTNLASGIVISIFLDRVNNPLRTAVKDLELEILEEDKRPDKLKNTELYLKNVTRRGLLKRLPMYGLFAGAISSFIFTVHFSDVPEKVDKIHGPEKRVNDREVRKITKERLWGHELLAYTLAFSGMYGAANYIYFLTPYIDEVKNAVYKHRINKALSNDTTHTLDFENKIYDLREILPDNLKAHGIELEVIINRGEEDLCYKLMFEQDKFLIKDLQTNSLKDLKVPIYNGDKVIIVVKQIHPCKI